MINNNNSYFAIVFHEEIYQEQYLIIAKDEYIHC